MHMLLAAGFAAAMLAVPAHAAGVDPLTLLLHQVDAPPGYQLDEDNSGATPNGLLRAYQPEVRDIIVRSGRVNGYIARYTNYGPPHWRYVVSGVDVFRTPAGARRYFDWLIQRIRRESKGRFRPSAATVGDGGLVYSERSDAQTGVIRGEGPQTGVIWREGRVVAIVSCQLMNGHRRLALGLARKQQRRIVAALG